MVAQMFGLMPLGVRSRDTAAGLGRISCQRRRDRHFGKVLGDLERNVTDFKHHSQRPLALDCLECRRLTLLSPKTSQRETMFKSAAPFTLRKGGLAIRSIVRIDRRSPTSVARQDSETFQGHVTEILFRGPFQSHQTSGRPDCFIAQCTSQALPGPDPSPHVSVYLILRCPRVCCVYLEDLERLLRLGLSSYFGLHTSSPIMR